MQVFVPYYLVICFSLLFVFANKKTVSSDVANVLTIILFVFFVIVIGFRDFDMVGDTRNYIQMFNQVENDFSGLISSRIEPGFVLFLKLFSLIGLSERQFIFSVAVFQSGLWCFVLRKYIGKPVNLLIGTFIFISMFFFYNLGSNVIRQGIAIPFLILSVHYLLKGEKTKFIVMALPAFLFHKTTLGIILIVYLVHLLKLKTSFWLVVLAVVTLFSITNLFTMITELGSFYMLKDYGAYIDGTINDSYKVGFRLDFWLFSMLPVFLFYLLHKQDKAIFTEKFNIYLALFSLFVFMFALPFSDRIGVYCWTFGCLLMAEFVGYYRFKLLNSKIVTISGIGIFGFLSFIFYRTLDFNYSFHLIF
ncbi:EpsG family protein [Aeromonas caviae]|jgi:hypothetical protein|uniref:EpsG family protein n=1 Tax=Aeromonas caviae TaxID=648 RepID=UPI000DE9B6D5|nr:EpsG family protein [Aeromonas caviae]RCE13344.1 hypothetical protein C6B42_19675 [Aeromonas caviae]